METYSAMRPDKKGTVSVRFTHGFGNNLFQYAFARLLAEAHDLNLNHPHLPGFDIPRQKYRKNRKLETVVIGINDGDRNYHQHFEPRELPCNFDVSGYFEDYTLYRSHLDRIRSWYPRVEKTNTRDLIVHLRLQNRLVAPSHHDSFVNFEGYRKAIEKFDFDRLHIVTDAEKWDHHKEEDIRKIQKMVSRNPFRRFVEVDESIAYINELVDGFRSFDPIIHAPKPTVARGALRDEFMDHFNLIRSFDQVVVFNSTFSWWAAVLSGATHVGVWEPWKPHKGTKNKNLGHTDFPGWFGWGSVDDLYRSVEPPTFPGKQ
jgi:hypothetical protein